MMNGIRRKILTCGRPIRPLIRVESCRTKLNCSANSGCRTERLRTALVHDDRKDLRRFIDRQKKYMRQEAAKLRATPWNALPVSGRVRKLRVIAPFATLLFTLFVKRAVLEGRAGLRYAAERFLAEAVLSIELFRGGL